MLTNIVLHTNVVMNNDLDSWTYTIWNTLRLIRGHCRTDSISGGSRWCITLWQNGVEKTSISDEEGVSFLETTKTASSTVNKHFSKDFLCCFVSFFDYFAGIVLSAVAAPPNSADKQEFTVVKFLSWKIN